MMMVSMISSTRNQKTIFKCYLLYLTSIAIGLEHKKEQISVNGKPTVSVGLGNIFRVYIHLK